MNRRNDFTCIETFDTMEEARHFVAKREVTQLVEDYIVKSSRMSLTNDADIET